MTGSPRVLVAGLGPGGADLVSAGTLEAIGRTVHRYLRTARHPAAMVAGDCPNFDHHYDAAARFDDVYRAIVDDLVAAALEHGEVLYLVPGSPRVLERSVDLLVGDGRVEVAVLPAMSFLDLAWVRLGVDPFEAGVRTVDGHRFAERAAAQRGPLLVAHCHNRRVLSDIKLTYDERTPERVVVLKHLGLPDEEIVTLRWEDLDRTVEPDHLTSLWIPESAPDTGAELVRFHELVRTLRSECPWDRAQSHASLTRHLLEETYEVLEAIEHLDLDTGGGDAALREELGDLLFQVVFHAVLAAERGAFTLAEVARQVHDKLRDRHPHVFAGAEVTSLDDLASDWEQRKAQEKGRASIMEGIPATLPALLYAQKVQKKASGAGADWRALAAAAGLDDASTGWRLLALVDEARTTDEDPETALRGAATQVRDAFDARPR